MVHILLAIGIRGMLLTVVVGLLNAAQVFRLRTLILRSREAEVLNTLQLAHSGGQAFQFPSFFRNKRQHQGVLCARKEIVSFLCACLQEGAFLLLALLLETGIQHFANHVACIIEHHIAQTAFQRVGRGIMFHGHEEERQLLLLVLANHIDALGVVGNGLQLHLGSIRSHLDATEEFLHLLLGAVHIDIANDDDALVVGAIPLAVIRTQRLRTTAVDDRHQSDGEALSIFRTRIQFG